MQGLKVGIAGAGKVAEESYLPCLVKVPGVELAYFSRTRARAEAAAARFGGRVFGSPAELVGWGPDTVFVLTREMDRYAAAMALLEAGATRLFLEKPLVAAAGQENVTERDFEDGRRLLQEAERRGCVTGMIFNYRFFDHSVLARQIAADRDFGRVINVVAATHYACWSHTIDLMHFFAGPLREICGREGPVVRTMPDFMSAPDRVAAFVTEAGAAGTLLGTTGLPWGFPLFELEINFERGRVHVQDLDGDLEVMDAQRGEHERYSIPREHSRWDQYHASFCKSIAAYLASIREGAAPPIPGKAGLLELQVEAGLQRSISENRTVRLAEEFPLGLS
jgi:predicted dehydrogenase